MQNKDYEEYVKKLAIHGTSDIDGNILHMILGIVTEAGELADAAKHAVGYNMFLDEDNVKEELGDTLFYVTGLAGLMGLTLEEVMELNKSKLDKRYPKGWSQRAAIDRKDKTE